MTRDRSSEDRSSGDRSSGDRSLDEFLGGADADAADDGNAEEPANAANAAAEEPAGDGGDAVEGVSDPVPEDDDDGDTATNPEPAGNDGDGDEDADAGTSPDTDTASAAKREREREPGVTPARATYEWSSGERACESCEASVRRRWRDGTAMVCRDCKSWE